jgi:deoxyribonuclease I
MNHRLHLLLIALLLTPACSEGGAAEQRDADQSTDAGEVYEPDADADAVDDTGDTDLPPQDFPDEIATFGASFDGTLQAGGKIEMALVAQAGDRVVIWLRKDGEPEWNPSLSIFRHGDDDALVWGNPVGNDDAHIPYQRGDLDYGWEFFDGGRYRLVLENFADVDGQFSFSLECVAGPCTGAIDSDGDGVPDLLDNCPSVPNADQADTNDSGLGDACDPALGNDPYEGLENESLREALEQDHQVHVGVSYSQARENIYASVDNHGGEVECVYTGQTVVTQTSVPDFNVEHTWPQSRGADQGDPNSDMHHLFPTTADSNQRRAAHHFGDVTRNLSWSEGGSRLGEDDSGAVRFEARDEHKGNVARAQFYFAVVYDHSIPAHEEEVLRRWHADDPVDPPERARNVAVAEIQNSRNPFIDRPDLVDRIDDF